MIVNNFLKWLKIIGIFISIVFGIIGSIILVIFFQKKDNKELIEYQNKLNKLLQGKIKDEKIINDSTIDDYDEHGNYIAGNNKRTNRKTNTVK